MICVGGGRGGVGKSVLAVNLGVYLAQLGRQVVVADADPAGSDLHCLVGLESAPQIADEALEADAVEPVPTPVPGLRLLPASPEASASSLFRPIKRARWASRLARLSADYVIVDLGAGTQPNLVDLFLAADVGVCVSAPEPTAIEATYRFLRTAYLRRFRRALVKDRFKSRLLERATAGLGPLASPLEVIAAVARFDSVVADVARAELARLRPSLAICQTRNRADVDLGPAMRAMAARYLGVDVDYLGHVEHDDAVWLTVRRRRPLLIDSPTSKGARNLERIARRILALATTRDASPVPPREPANEATLSLYERLGIGRSASDEEVRRAYRRQRELFSAGSLPLTSLVWGEALVAEQARIDEAHDTLLDPVRRRAYDVATFPEPEQSLPPASDADRQGLAAELTMLQAELSREINAETHFTGALLRKVRESQGVDVAEIATRTKIAAAHLHAIEAEAFTELPALVYTRGFVQQLAKYLALDPAQVARTYLARMRDALAATGRTLG